MATTKQRLIVRVVVLIAATSLVLTVIARTEAAPHVCADDACASGSPAAQRKARENTLLDKVGLGSLRRVAWEAFPAALALSALIGAAGGFVYAGIVGGGRSAKNREDEERDRSSP